MHTYRSVFTNEHAILIVIHVGSVEQARLNAEIAFQEDIDGIWLIQHECNHVLLRRAYLAIRSRFPDKWIGLNWLGLSPSFDIQRMEPGMNGLWVDNAGVYDDEGKTAIVAGKNAVMLNTKLDGMQEPFLYFGGVAFKGQHEVFLLKCVAEQAVPYMDVITTTGDATGHPPSVEKMFHIREGAGNHPVAIASGMTPENVREYLRFADCFLVATGVSHNEYNLNPRRLELFARNVRG